MSSDALLDLRRALALVWVGATLLLPAWILALRGQPEAAGVRLRRALETLGVTYLKLGQYLAIRFDIVPPAIGHELERLFDRVSPLTYADVATVVEAELGAPPEAAFAWVDPEPIASASIAQVHEARTHAGVRVAIKVQRPGIEPILRADLRNMERIAALVDLLGLVGGLSARETVQELAAWTLRELDFLTEADAADRLRDDLGKHEHAPTIFRELSTARILTMELIDGLSLSAVGRLYDAGGASAVHAALPGIDLELTLRRFFDGYLYQLFVGGFFHGDPHPGNVILRRDSTVAYVDFGIYGELTPYELTVVRRHVEAVAVGDIPTGLRYFVKQVHETPDTDLSAFRNAIADVLQRWYDASRDRDRTSTTDRHLGRYSGEMLELVRRHRLRMRMGALLFWRSLIIVNSTVLRFPGLLDPLAATREFFQPEPLEVAAGVARGALDGRRALETATILRDAPEQVRLTVEEVARRDRPWLADIEEPGPVFRANDRQARGIALALVGLSLGLVGIGGGAGPIDPARLVALVALVPVTAIALRELSPR